jgi:hypothetical protein
MTILEFKAGNELGARLKPNPFTSAINQSGS